MMAGTIIFNWFCKKRSLSIPASGPTTQARTLNQPEFSSVQDGIYAFGKSPMCSNPSLRSFPKAESKTGGWLCRFRG